MSIKKNKFLKNLSLESLLSNDELDYLRIVDEKTGENDKDVEVYDALITLISTGVSLSHTISKKTKLLSTKINVASLPSHKESQLNKLKQLITKLGTCNRTISEYVMDIYEYCEKTNRFWHNSSVKTYESYYTYLKKMYLQKFKEAIELDFLKSEYKYFIRVNTEDREINPTHNSIKETDEMAFVGYYKWLNADEREFLNVVNQRKLDFISNKILELGYYIQFIKEKEELFLNFIPVNNEKNDFDTLDEEILSKSNLPSFSLSERFELTSRLGITKKIESLDILKKEKNKLLALVMNCSVDNARKLMDTTYKKVVDKSKEVERIKNINAEVDDYLYRNKIKLGK